MVVLQGSLPGKPLMAASLTRKELDTGKLPGFQEFLDYLVPQDRSRGNQGDLRRRDQVVVSGQWSVVSGQWLVVSGEQKKRRRRGFARCHCWEALEQRCLPFPFGFGWILAEFFPLRYCTAALPGTREPVRELTLLSPQGVCAVAHGGKPWEYSRLHDRVPKGRSKSGLFPPVQSPYRAPRTPTASIPGLRSASPGATAQTPFGLEPRRVRPCAAIAGRPRGQRAAVAPDSVTFPPPRVWRERPPPGRGPVSGRVADAAGQKMVQRTVPVGAQDDQVRGDPLGFLVDFFLGRPGHQQHRHLQALAAQKLPILLEASVLVPYRVRRPDCECIWVPPRSRRTPVPVRPRG